MTMPPRIRTARACWARRALGVWLTSAALGVSAGACTGTADDSKLPPNVQDPATLKTPSGAIARYRGALSYLPGAIDWVMTTGGILTDELAALPAPLGTSTAFTGLDSRTDPSGLGELNAKHLHNLRAQAREARGFLAAYAPDSSPALQGHMYAIEAYAEIFLADLFCSGIPLSTVDFDGTYTLTPGFTTTEVYRHAAALFDSALALAGDSLRLQQLTAVGKARALLAMGNYADAAAAVSTVPDDYSYQVQFTYGDYPVLIEQQALPESAALWAFHNSFPSWLGVPSAADREGENGLDYRSSGDPRTATLLLGSDRLGNSMYFPAKYPEFGPVTFVLASGVEARLIEAEAALKVDSGEWLTTLNALRTDGAYDTQPNAADPSQTDTLWHAGTGEVPGLRPLEDPGTAVAREDLLFRERAFWLYLTGHRQGDLRRLIRQYGRGPDAVYPSGVYSGGGGSYGGEIVVPYPKSEQELNVHYAGCISRNA